MMKLKLMLGVVFIVGIAAAQTNAPPTGWSPFVRGGSVYQADAGLDSGGEFSVHRFYAEGGAAYLFGRGRLISLSAGYGQDDYHFTGLPAEPWNNIENFRASIFNRWAFNREWTSFAVLSARTYAEQNADLSDSFTAAAIGGVSYRFSDRLSLGPGFGVIGQLEDNTRYFPILVIDWNITERLNLSTGKGMASTTGPGLTLGYKLTRNWNLGLGGRYEKKRFRLDDKSIAPEGIGEDSNFPLFGSVRYVLYPGTEVSALLGMNFAGRLKVEDENGNSRYRSDYDESLFGGITASVRF